MCPSRLPQTLYLIWSALHGPRTCRCPTLHVVVDVSVHAPVAQAEVSYEYLRETGDQGSYLGPSRVLINKRKRRSGPKATLEYLSQQNHSLLSHDNVWAPTKASSHGKPFQPAADAFCKLRDPSCDSTPASATHLPQLY